MFKLLVFELEVLEWVVIKWLVLEWYIALQGTTKDPLPQVKLGETLNLLFFGVCF